VPATKAAPPVIAAVKEKMERFVADREIAGAVTLVAQDGRIVHRDATGRADLAADRPIRPDALFWIASMTKPITATAVLMLQDEGKLSIDDPVDRYLPEFKSLKTADGKLARVTIKHLLTHTSGLAELSPEQSRKVKTLAEAVSLFVAKPVAFEPGSKWVYCQSGINAAGRVVEVVSGQTFPEFLQARLFQPLGMRDTTFYPTEAQVARLARTYRKTSGGELEEVPVPVFQGKPLTSHDRFPEANGGLFSTARDYARFAQMLLDGGTYRGKPYLKPETVKQMTTIQTGDLATGFTPGNGWGIGCCVVRAPQGVTAMLSPGSFGHGGAFGTQAWIDPKARRIYILMIQSAGVRNSDGSPVRLGFQQAAAAALGDRASGR
jgi:CubicO group peptidase (beta-lactamase class C family)